MQTYTLVFWRSRNHSQLRHCQKFVLQRLLYIFLLKWQGWGSDTVTSYSGFISPSSKSWTMEEMGCYLHEFGICLAFLVFPHALWFCILWLNICTTFYWRHDGPLDIQNLNAFPNVTFLPFTKLTHCLIMSFYIQKGTTFIFLSSIRNS